LIFYDFQAIQGRKPAIFKSTQLCKDYRCLTPTSALLRELSDWKGRRPPKKGLWWRNSGDETWV